MTASSGGQPGLAFPDKVLRNTATMLSADFAGIFGPETVERYVLESYAALLRTAVHVRSAGSQPASTIHPNVLAAAAESNLDLSHEFPKPLTDDVVQAADVVVTMGCGDACPLYPGKRYLDWELDDPAELDLNGVRRVRDEIEDRVATLLEELGVTPIH